MLDQDEVTAWHRRAHPDADLKSIALKLSEEAGEVSRAVNRIIEGRGTDADLAEELGDVAICLARLASRRGLRLDEVVAERWTEVRQRSGFRHADFVDDPTR